MKKRQCQGPGCLLSDSPVTLSQGEKKGVRVQGVRVQGVRVQGVRVQGVRVIAVSGCCGLFFFVLEDGAAQDQKQMLPSVVVSILGK